jgi:glycine/D-amino acid oxidase-like deaminating enzyme
MSEEFDLAVIGGGIMGCATALRAAEGGMRVILLEQDALCSGASGVNAGTLSLQIKRIKLMPYALRGHAWWEAAGEAVGFRRTGGCTLAFTETEAEQLEERMALKAAAGAPIEMVSPAEVCAREPGLSRRIVAASWCAADGYANSSRTGSHFRLLLREGGIEAREHTPVSSIERANAFSICAGEQTFRAHRLLLACGAWLPKLAAMIGLELNLRIRVNTVSVTERVGPVLRAVVGHATGLLTMKQKENGTILIGGGWQGRGNPAQGRGEVVAETMLRNLQLARFALPALAGLRVVRAWTGFEPNAPDFYPLAGAIPGIPGLFVLGCVRGGYTIGPYIGRLMGDLILCREPEMPLFDPSRLEDLHAM